MTFVKFCLKLITLENIIYKLFKFFRMMEVVKDFITENWIVLGVVAFVAFLLIAAIVKKVVIKEVVDVKITEIEGRDCKGIFSHSGRLMNAVLSTVPEGTEEGDFVECLLGDYVESEDAWEVTPLSFIVKSQKIS